MERLEKFYASTPKQHEDIFSYISQVETMVEDLEKLQYLAHEAGESLKIPKFTVTWKILSAVESFHNLKHPRRNYTKWNQHSGSD